MPMKSVLEFIYIVISSHAEMINLGWVISEKNKELLTSNWLLYSIKSKIYDIYIMLVVLYGIKFVNQTSTLYKKIETSEKP